MNNQQLLQILFDKSKIIDDWIIEQYTKDGKIITLGKIIVPYTIHLNNQQLEIIWDLCNYGPAGYNIQPIKYDCPYNNCLAIFQSEMIYIPIAPVDYCNDDIFIRKHNNVRIGYWINEKSKYKWMYSDRYNWKTYMAKKYNLT